MIRSGGRRPSVDQREVRRCVRPSQITGDRGQHDRYRGRGLTGRFWNGAIQNYWNEIAQTASLAHNLTTAENARLFALLNLSFADSVIAFYDAKYTYNFWRHFYQGVGNCNREPTFRLVEHVIALRTARRNDRAARRQQHASNDRSGSR